MKKMMCWQMVIGQFKNSRAEDIKELFYIIMFVCYRIYKKYAWFSWQVIVVAKHMTWVRAPGLHNSNIIFQFTFTYSINDEYHGTPSEPSVHASWEIKSKA